MVSDRPGRLTFLIYAIRLKDDDANALDLARRKIRLLPSDYGAREVLLDLVALHAEPDETLAILEDPNRRPNLSTAKSEAYRRFALWRKGGSTDDRLAAIAAVTAAAKVGIPPESAAPMLVRLGDLDAAFDSAESRADPQSLAVGPPYNSTFLYFTETAPMRRDPRFIALADKLGLLQFWRETGAWPDFCRKEPGPVCAQMQGG